MAGIRNEQWTPGGGWGILSLVAAIGVAIFAPELIPMAVLPNLNNLSKEQLIALLNAANTPRKLSMKVSPKGALSVYGLGRFPVTLYASQWERLLSAADDIRAFATANTALLAKDKA